MPEVNTDKIFAAFLLRLEEVAQIEDFDDIEKEFLGKNSLLSEERKSLSSLNEVSRKKYGKLLQDLSNNITSKLEEEKITFKSKFFIQKELNDNNFKEVVVSTENLEVNYKSLYKIRKDFKELGISNYYKEKSRANKKFYEKTTSLFKELVAKHDFIPVEIEISTFTSWK